MRVVSQIVFHSRWFFTSIFFAWAPIQCLSVVVAFTACSARPGPAFAPLFPVNTESWGTEVNRRAFARSIAGMIAGAISFPSIIRAMQATASERLALGVVYGSGTESFKRGVELGVNEVLRTANVLRKAITTYNVSLDSRMTPRRAIEVIGAKSAPLVIVCAGDAQISEMAAEAKLRSMTILDCCSRSDALRHGYCETLFHIEASDAMYAAAARQTPQAKAVVLWDSALERFGAAQLNDRFRDFARAPMDSAAWAGWVAVKIAWESFIRAPASLRAYMISDKAQFDGHKGAPLSFRPWDRQLRQPLYSRADRLIDVPDISRSSRPVRELLDTLGEPAGTDSCVR